MAHTRTEESEGCDTNPHPGEQADVDVGHDNVSPRRRGQCERRLIPWGRAHLVLWITLCVLVGAVEGRSPTHLILRPQRVGQRDVAVVLVPEAGLENTAYEEMATAWQTGSAIPLWVCVLDTTSTDGGPRTSDSIEVSVRHGLEEMRIRGFNPGNADIFLAGHGLGGDLVAAHVSRAPSLYRGAILLGTHLKTEFNVASFPVAVLTLSGDLDGLSPLTSLAMTFRSMKDDVTLDKTRMYTNPIVVLEGFNHGVFSSGELPGPMQARDINPEGNIEDGQRLIANYTSLFVCNVLQTPEVFVQIARMKFREAFEKAVLITKPILDIQDVTQNSEGESYFVRTAQMWLSGLLGHESQRLTVENYIVPDATEIPPSVLVEGDQSVVIRLITFSDVLRSVAKDGSPGAPVEIAARMLSPERIRKELRNTTALASYTCKDINYGSYLTAYHTASDVARERYDRSHGGIVFHTDRMVQSDIAWKLTLLAVDARQREIHVTSASYMTPTLNSLGERAGLYYCKLLPPDRVMEWIYVDSLRRTL